MANKSSKNHAALEKHLEKMAQHHAKIVEHMKMINHEKKEKKLIGKPEKKMAKAAKSGSPKVKKEVALAHTLSKLRKK